MQASDQKEVNFRQALLGDRNAFALLVREHQSMVFSLARHHLHDEAGAEEIAQETFLELHGHLKGLQSSAHVVNWLRKVATRRCIDYSRRPANRPKLTLDQIPETTEAYEPPDHFVRRSIENLLASLPEKQRMVMILRYQEDLEPTEIADTLSMPINTVKSYLQRSLSALRDKLDKMQVRS